MIIENSRMNACVNLSTHISICLFMAETLGNQMISEYLLKETFVKSFVIDEKYKSMSDCT